MERVMLYPLINNKMISLWNKFKIPNKEQIFTYVDSGGRQEKKRIEMVYTQENRTYLPVNFYIDPNHPRPDGWTSYSEGEYCNCNMIYSTSDFTHELRYDWVFYRLNKAANRYSTGWYDYKANAFYPCIQVNDSKYDEGPILKKVIKEYM